MMKCSNKGRQGSKRICADPLSNLNLFAPYTKTRPPMTADAYTIVQIATAIQGIGVLCLGVAVSFYLREQRALNDQRMEEIRKRRNKKKAARKAGSGASKP